MKADYAKRGYHYMKNYGLSTLYLKARNRLERVRLQKNYQEFLFAGSPVESELQLQR